MITTCPKCGRNYEETSDETANDPARLCMPCWHMSKVQEAERKVAQIEKERDIDRKYMREQSDGIATLCGLVDRFIRRVTEGLRPSEEFAKAIHGIRDAWDKLGWCENCGQMGCPGDCREDDR